MFWRIAGLLCGLYMPGIVRLETALKRCWCVFRMSGRGAGSTQACRLASPAMSAKQTAVEILALHILEHSTKPTTASSVLPNIQTSAEVVFRRACSEKCSMIIGRIACLRLLALLALAALPLEGLALKVVARNSVDMMDVVTCKTPNTRTNIDTTCRMGQCLSRLQAVVLHLQVANNALPCHSVSRVIK